MFNSYIFSLALLLIRNPPDDMPSEAPFQISVPDDALALLRRKLSDARFPDEIDDAGWDYGVPLSDLKRLVDKWKDSYDWRVHERELNKLPMFTRDLEVEGFGVLNIHYVHQRSEVQGAIPLLFVHGCASSPSSLFACVADQYSCLGPGSFIEVTKILPLLTAGGPGYPSFHVVAPSIPGYAWSEGVSNKGFRSRNYAEVGAQHDLNLWRFLVLINVQSF